MNSSRKTLDEILSELEALSGQPPTQNETTAIKKAVQLRAQLNLLGWSWLDFTFYGALGPESFNINPSLSSEIVARLWKENQVIAQEVGFLIE